MFGMVDERGLVPPRRLGALLAERRRAEGLELAQVAARSRGVFDVRALEAIERGRVELSDDLVAAVTALYAVESGPVLPHRSQLVIDLRGPELRVGHTVAPLPDEPTADELLGRYLSLLYLLRSREPGTPLPLRTADLERLSEALFVTVGDVRDRLSGLMVQPEVADRAGRFRARLVVPAVGLLVGVTAVGSLILVTSDDPEPAASPTLLTPAVTAPAPAPAAESVATSPAPASEAADLVVDSPEIVPVDLAQPAPPADVEVDIGDPVTIVPGATVDDPTVDIGAPVAVTPTPVADPGTPNGQPAAPGGAAAQLLGAEAEALLGYPIRDLLPEWTIEYLGPLPGYRGNTNLPTLTISVYVGASDTATSVAEVLAHEAGHALDITYLDNPARVRWLEARGVPDAAWWPGNGLSDFDTGAGDFSEAVAFWLVGSPSRSTLAGNPTPEQVALLEQLLP